MFERLVMEKNTEIEIEITDITAEGSGVGRYDGMAVFVKGAVTGDRVEAKIIKISSSFLVGRLERIIKSSPNRVDGEG